MVANILLLSDFVSAQVTPGGFSKVHLHPCRNQRAQARSTEVFSYTVPMLAPESIWLQLGIKSPKNTSGGSAVFT